MAQASSSNTRKRERKKEWEERGAKTQAAGRQAERERVVKAQCTAHQRSMGRTRLYRADLHGSVDRPEF